MLLLPSVPALELPLLPTAAQALRVLREERTPTIPVRADHLLPCVTLEESCNLPYKLLCES